MKNQIAQIGKVLSYKYEESNPNDLLEHGKQLSAILAMSSETVALAKKELQLKEDEFINSLTKPNSPYSGLPASILKKKIESYCTDEEYNLRLSERQNAGIVHKIDMVRSSLSYLKSEINNLGA